MWYRTTAARLSTTPLNSAPREPQQISKDLALLSPEEKEQKRKLQSYITLEEPVCICIFSHFTHNITLFFFLGWCVTHKSHPARAAEEPPCAHLRAGQERYAERYWQHTPLGDGIWQPSTVGESTNGVVLNVSIKKVFSYYFIFLFTLSTIIVIKILSCSSYLVLTFLKFLILCIANYCRY